VIIWTRISPLYYDGNMGYAPGTPLDQMVHMMTVKWSEKKKTYLWYAGCENGHTERGSAWNHEEAQEECEEAANRLRILPSLYPDDEDYEDEEDEEVA
jgi:hypothetical protein